MGTTATTERMDGMLCKIAQGRKEYFEELDSKARKFEQKYKSAWVDLSNLCVTMRDEELWKEGGFHSFNAWLLDACPMSRRMAYLAMGIREELSEIPEEELREIPLSNAEVLQKTPKQYRNGEILKAAKKQGRDEFVATVVQEAPLAHLEEKQVHKFRWTSSQSEKAREAMTRWRLLNDDPDAPAEVALEGIIADYMLTTEGDYERKLRAKIARR